MAFSVRAISDIPELEITENDIISVELVSINEKPFLKTYIDETIGYILISPENFIKA